MNYKETDRMNQQLEIRCKQIQQGIVNGEGERGPVWTEPQAPRLVDGGSVPPQNPNLVGSGLNDRKKQ